MPHEDVTARLRRAPATVECPICRHRQRVTSAEERCDQCGSEIALFGSRDEARSALDAWTSTGRIAYLREIPGGFFAVVANRSFPPRDA